MTPVTRYAKSGDVFIAFQVTGDAPIPMVNAPGVRPADVDDRVLATVLFVDVGNSTQALSTLGDNAWKGAVEGRSRRVGAICGERLDRPCSAN